MTDFKAPHPESAEHYTSQHPLGGGGSSCELRLARSKVMRTRGTRYNERWGGERRVSHFTGDARICGGARWLLKVRRVIPSGRCALFISPLTQKITRGLELCVCVFVVCVLCVCVCVLSGQMCQSVAACVVSAPASQSWSSSGLTPPLNRCWSLLVHDHYAQPLCGSTRVCVCVCAPGNRSANPEERPGLLCVTIPGVGAPAAACSLSSPPPPPPPHRPLDVRTSQLLRAVVQQGFSFTPRLCSSGIRW